MSHIFISYSRKDREYVRQFVESLKEKRIPFWIDTSNIRYGAAWFQSIEAAIGECAGMVVVMSETAKASDWVRKEIMIGLQSNKPVFPLLLQGSGMPMLIDIHYADVRNSEMPPDEYYQELIAVVGTSREPAPLHEQLMWPKAPISFPFRLINNTVAFTTNFSQASNCKWQGFGGVILSEEGNPLHGIRIHVFDGKGLDLYSISGTAPIYGDGGWELQVTTTPNQETYFVELEIAPGLVISPTVQVTFPGQCDGNLAIVNFAQLHSEG